METQRLRRRRSRRKARKKQIGYLTVFALVIAALVWTRILVDRHNDASMFAGLGSGTAPVASDEPDTPTSPATAAAAAAVATPRNVVLFIGTGFGTVPLTATRLYAGGDSGTLAIDKLPETAIVRTTSRNAQTADGAAAMTAYLTGQRVDNEVLSQTPETRPYDEAGRPQSAHGETACASVGNGKPVTTLLELAKTSGRAIGIVTTARVTQSIAASYAHLCQRDGENTIATQLVPGGSGGNPKLGNGIDVVLGGGWERFLPKDDPRGSARNDGRDLFAELRAKGYAVIGRQNELAAIGPSTTKLIGLFARGPMDFELDRASTPQPSLAEMTARAIDLLATGPKGYLLIVEGGRIGDALDGALARKALAEGRAFDDAVGAALERIRLRDPDLHDTTVVVTADHDHTMVLAGDNAATERTIESRAGVLGLVHKVADPTQLATDATDRPYPAIVFGTGPKRLHGPRSQAPPLTDFAMTDKAMRHEAAIELASAVGGADVPLAAAGANAARFHGTLDNVQVYGLLREALGL